MSILSESKRPLQGHPPYGLRKGIEAIKAEVSVEQYLRDRGVEVKRNRARCLVHDGDNPQSFAVYPDQGRWHCFRCNEGGDVIDLCRAVEGGSVWEAMIVLAQRYAVELPDRGDHWRSWQDEKGKRCRMVREAMADSYQRRLFRLFGGFLADIEDADEYDREAEAFFERLRPVAVGAATNRMRADA